MKNINLKNKVSDNIKREVFISVDIETDGPIPGDYSISSLGACVIGTSDLSFYMEFKPISDKFNPEAISISGLDRNQLIANGTDPTSAMQRFSDWLEKVSGTDGSPVFVAFNATFDWMFVHWYFQHFIGRNPFGISGWDIKAYYAGVTKKRFWAETSKKRIDKEFLSTRPHTHNALDDAQEQAEIFQRLRRKAGVD